MRKRGELVERSFAHVLDRGGMRRAWLRGRENIAKRYLIHVAGFNLGVLMRALFGRGTPREAADIASGLLWITLRAMRRGPCFYSPLIRVCRNHHFIIGVTADRR